MGTLPGAPCERSGPDWNGALSDLLHGATMWTIQEHNRMKTMRHNVLPLKPALEAAERGGYALGAFAPRYTSMIQPILRAGERTGSPLIVQNLTKRTGALRHYAGGFRG